MTTASARTAAKEPTLSADDVARVVVYVASLPLNANFQFLTVMVPTMPFRP